MDDAQEEGPEVELQPLKLGANSYIVEPAEYDDSLRMVRMLLDDWFGSTAHAEANRWVKPRCDGLLGFREILARCRCGFWLPSGLGRGFGGRLA